MKKTTNRAFKGIKAYSIHFNLLELFKNLKNGIDEDKKTLYDKNNLKNLFENEYK